MKTCSACKLPKPETDFYPGRANGSTRAECKKCSNRRVSSIRKTQRANSINRASYILQDARRFDKKRGLVNDLTKTFIETLLVHPCIYCGDSFLTKTLDRIDNRIGHMQGNVLTACIRCNYMRRDMPYEAWLMLLPGIREAVRLGLFGEWTGSTH